MDYARTMCSFELTRDFPSRHTRVQELAFQATENGRWGEFRVRG